MSIPYPPRKVLAADFERGKTRLEQQYKDLRYTVLKTAPEHVDDRLSIPDVLFLIEQKDQTIVVVFLEHDEDVQRLTHLNRFRNSRDYILNVHVLEPSKEVLSIRSMLIWATKQNWLMSALGLPVIAAIGWFVSLLYKDISPTIWAHIDRDSGQRQVATMSAKRPLAPPAPPVLQPIGKGLPTSSTKNPVSLPPKLPSLTPSPPAEAVGAAMPYGAPRLRSEDDADLLQTLQVYLRRQLKGETALQGLPTPTLVLRSSLSYTYRDETADCTIDGSIVAGSRILVAMNQFPGTSNEGQTVNALVNNACLAAIDTMVRNYFSQ